MLSRSLRLLTSTGALALAASASTALGQCFPFFNPFCCSPCPAPRPTACYQTVPVTEYRECRQTVQKPVVETKYVDQPVTEYKQVVETKTAEVPTCTYQNVTEMRAVQRDCGQWVTECHQRPNVTPCQYDNRPDLFGFLNRTGFMVRMAFTPQTWTERVYVPNVVTTQVPVTRQVAVRGTQTINYQVAKMVPVTTTRKVAVNTVRMVSEEIVTKRPVTVFKTVPMGSSLALGIPATPPAPATTTTALQPTPESRGTSAIMPRKSNGDATKVARKINEELNDDDDAVGRGGSNSNSESPVKKMSNELDEQGSIRVPRPSADEADEQDVAGKDRPIGRWVARKRNAPKSVEGPVFPEVAQTRGKKK